MVLLKLNELGMYRLKSVVVFAQLDGEACAGGAAPGLSVVAQGERQKHRYCTPDCLAHYIEERSDNVMKLCGSIVVRWAPVTISVKRIPGGLLMMRMRLLVAHRPKSVLHCAGYRSTMPSTGAMARKAAAREKASR